ncbi:hypothetical protein GLW20_02385 [Virgibacillus halodenitrificans]|nr:hypothetical protein [Virgibacillus halodenitrificans]
MWYDIFFDQNNNFQWASIAAIVSFFALCSTTISIFITQSQAKKHRKSSTLISLRIEELKEVRKEVSTIMSTVGNLRSVTEKSQYEEIIKIYVEHQNILFSILYRDNQHTEEFIEKIYQRDSEVLKLENKYDIGDWVQEFEFAAKKYSKIEYKEIEKHI